MKLINLLVKLFAITLLIKSSEETQLNLTQLNELVNLAQKLQTNLTSLVSDEKFQEQASHALKNLLSNITNQDHKQLIENLLPKLMTLNLNSTNEINDILKPILTLFNLPKVDIASLIKHSHHTLHELMGSSLNYLNEIFSSHDTSYYIREFESFLKRVITKLFANKQVQNALKKVLQSAELVFGKVDYVKLLQQIQNGYTDVLANPKILELIQKSLIQLKDVFF